MHPAPGHEHKYAFTVAVVGDRTAMEGWQVRRLIELLVNRHSGRRRIVLLTGGAGPDVGWANDVGWFVHVVPALGNYVKQDCEFVYQADAVLVLGDPGPWARLITLATDAGVPVRTYRTCPRLPPPPDFDPERMYRGSS